MGISILIRTYNSARTLRSVLEGLHLDNEDELIVVDSGSSDSTISIAESFGAEIIRYIKPFNYSATLNIGFESARNEWVLVLSSHTIPAHDSFMAVLRQFAAAASADIVVGYGSSVMNKLIAASLGATRAYERLAAGELSCGAGNTLALYRKSAWKEHQFDTNIQTAEDLEWLIWADQQGYAAARITGLVGVYRNQGTLAHMFRKGWNEVKQARDLKADNARPSIRRSITSVLFGLAYFTKLWATGRVPFTTMCRQQSHHLGAWFATILTCRESPH